MTRDGAQTADRDCRRVRLELGGEAGARGPAADSEPEPPPTRGAVILIGQAAAPLRDGLRFMLAPLWCDLGCCSRTVVVDKAAVNPRLSSSPSRALLVKTKLLARGAYDRQDRLRSRPVALCL